MELNINQLMDLTGKSFRTIKKLLGPLEPVREDGKASYWDSREALKLLYPTHTSELQQETLLLERARREKLDIEVGQMRGKLIPLEDIKKVVEREYGFVRAQVRQIPSKLAKPMSMISDPMEAFNRLSETVEETLTELTADKQYADLADQLRAVDGRVSVSETDGTEADSEAESGGVGGSVQVPESGE